MSEETIWIGRSSQIKNLGTYILCGLFCWLIVPLFVALWKWLGVRSREFRLTSERLLITEGIFSKTTDSLELYRVKDIRTEQPFLLRLFQLENIKLVTTDETSPVVVIDYIAREHQLSDQLRQHVEACRVAKRVREVDVE